MDTKINFETGKDYTLADLFSNNNKIIIPDLQRDYCWGLKDNLAKNFVVGLFDYFENTTRNNSKLGLGMIYGYEEPIGHIQLCDGQQRITTLFLLIGMLNRYSEPSGRLRKYLISEEEINDDKEPYLLYSIRESTLYFLSDLIIHFFFSKNIPIEKIKDQPWYFMEYDLDPSIQSMLAVLSQIEEVLSKKTNIDDFSKFLLHDLTFLYYDMEGRKNGEETFVIINTTGEPLTATENLKPLLLSRIKDDLEKKEGSDTWEKWENFFWINRLRNDTADNGLKEFLRWIMLLSLDIESDDFREIQDSGQFVFDKTISIKEIDSYYEIMNFIKENDIVIDFAQYLAPENSDNHNQINWFKVLPVIKYIKKWGNSNLKEIKRIYHFFFNLAKQENVGKAITDLLPEALRIIDKMDTADICSFLDINDISKSILTEEEKYKLTLYKMNPKTRDQIEMIFWQYEDKDLWNGEIKTLLLWASNGTLAINEFSYNKFVEYSQKVDNLFNQTDLDMLRRTLLTFIDNNNYPKILHGYTNYSFCSKASDWKTILGDNYLDVKKLLDSLNLNDDIIQQQEKLMTRPNCTFKYNLDQLIKHEEILKHASGKNFQWDDKSEDWLIIPKEKATKYANLSNYVIYLNLTKKGNLCNSDFTRKTDDRVYYEFLINNVEWDLWFYEDTDGNCTVISSDEKKIIIDISSEYSMEFGLNIRHKDKNKTETSLKRVASTFNLSLKNDRYYSIKMNEEKTIELLQKLLTFIN